MQSAVPEAVDFSSETAATRRLYGVDDPISGRFGASCLMARRLVERGVRFVQILTGSAGDDDWDNAHADNDRPHQRGMVKKATGACLNSLNQFASLLEPGTDRLTLCRIISYTFELFTSCARNCAPRRLPVSKFHLES